MKFVEVCVKKNIYEMWGFVRCVICWKRGICKLGDCDVY